MSNAKALAPKAILFDLDGTLIDTAADLCTAINRMCIEHQRPPIAIDQLRPFISAGSRAMLQCALGMDPDHPKMPGLRQQLFSYYAETRNQDSVIFPGILEMLDDLDANKITWGVVTNKPDFLAKQVIKDINLDTRTHCLIAADGKRANKPSPAPLLDACAALKLNPQLVYYAGDAIIDVQAGRAADMTTIAVRYGYHAAEPAIDDWQANYIIDKSTDWPQWARTNLY